MLVKILVSCSVLFVACSNNEIKEESVKEIQDSGVVTLTGTLTYQRFWGAPNYGEDTLTDAKEIVPVLKTDTADIQLVTNKNLRSLENKKVSARGKLFDAQTGHHHTNVLLDLKEIK
jgi:hypothetical protein